MKHLLSGYIKIALFLFIGCFSINHCQASWVDTSDIYLRSDIQALADAGIIKTPVNTFPLMWSGIKHDLTITNINKIPADLINTFNRVNKKATSAEQINSTSIDVTLATDPARFLHFGSDYREKGQMTIKQSLDFQRIHFNLSASANLDATDDKTFRLDNSYLSIPIGNWQLSAGAFQQWYGPGYDTSLQKSNNARPLPTIMINRNDAHGFETPWLSWIGPWTLATSISSMESDRAVANPLLWNFRGTFRPFKQLEIGASWAIQFCGKGQPCGWKRFFDAITGGTECSSQCGPGFMSKDGAQLAGYDVRYTDSLFGIPLGVYYQRTCEDSKGSGVVEIVDCGFLAGIDTRFTLNKQSQKLFIEYSDTLVACGSDPHIFNCFYEHSTYRSGYRYYRKTLGSTYESDSRSIVAGLINQFDNQQALTALLRYVELNKDGSSPNTSWSPQIAKERLKMLELSYRLPLWQGMVSFGGTVSNSQFTAAKTKNNATIFGRYNYQF
ncbi:MAG: capsule assembly Wzi family protein [Parashewanella sp.]